MNRILLAIVCVVFGAMVAQAQSNGPIEPPRKANARATAPAAAVGAEPFDGASVEKMASQCVTLETELGAIDIAFMPEVAPEAVKKLSQSLGYGRA